MLVFTLIHPSLRLTFRKNSTRSVFIYNKAVFVITDLSYFHHGPISDIVLASVLKIIDKPVILSSVQLKLSDKYCCDLKSQD